MSRAARKRPRRAMTGDGSDANESNEITCARLGVEIRSIERNGTVIPVHIFPSQGALREWYEVHHGDVKEMWFGFYRKGHPHRGLSHPEALDLALCYGWIDGVARRVDDQVFALRFTPRRARSHWSRKNLARMQELLDAKDVAEPGLRTFEGRDPTAPQCIRRSCRRPTKPCWTGTLLPRSGLPRRARVTDAMWSCMSCPRSRRQPSSGGCNCWRTRARAGS